MSILGLSCPTSTSPAPSSYRTGPLLHWSLPTSPTSLSSTIPCALFPSCSSFFLTVIPHGSIILAELPEKDNQTGLLHLWYPLLDLVDTLDILAVDPVGPGTGYQLEPVPTLAL